MFYIIYDCFRYYIKIDKKIGNYYKEKEKNDKLGYVRDEKFRKYNQISNK